MKTSIASLLILATTVLSLRAEVIQTNSTPPTFANVKYGPAKHQRFDFWQAKSDQPTPVLFYIHGGGWLGGDKSVILPALLHFMLDHGISVASINYRLSSEAKLPAPVHDAARALQYIRSKAAEWNVNKERIAAMGGSAGGCTSLWLAYHDDLADPNNPDPVLRESSRVCAAVGVAGQTSIDPKVIIPWTGDQIMNHPMTWRCVGATNLADAMTNYAKYRDLYHEFSPINHVSADDPPVFMYYLPPSPLPAPNKDIAIHHAILGQKLKEKADAAGLECELQYDKEEPEDGPVICAFLLKKLTKSGAERTARTPRDVFIFAGQSNMAGNDAVIPDPPGFFSTDADRRTLYTCGPLPEGSDAKFGYCPWDQLKGHRINIDLPRQLVQGPEVGFARRLYEANIRDIAILAVHANFLRTATSWPWSEGGYLNNAWLKYADARLEDLRKQGFEPRIRGFVWHQGIDDAIHGKLAEHYQENLTALIAFMRHRYHVEDAPFILARSANSALVRRGGGSYRMNEVREAQVKVGESVANTAWINVDDLPNVAEHHFSADSQLIIGNRFGDAYLRLTAGVAQAGK